ncbi:MAG: bactofilin family protein [Silvanigrellaceae bacterium]
MFSKKPQSENSNIRSPEPTTKMRSRGISMLADGCSFQGKMFLQGESRVGGHVDGSVVCDGVLTVEESAVITGDLNGVVVLFNGRIDGNLKASDLLRLSPTARVYGDLAAKRLIVEDGARIEGRVSYLTAQEVTNEDNSSNGNQEETQVEEEEVSPVQLAV